MMRSNLLAPSLLRTLVLYAGPSPVRVNQPVLSPEGLVGRVVVVAPGPAVARFSPPQCGKPRQRRRLRDLTFLNRGAS